MFREETKEIREQRRNRQETGRPGSTCLKLVIQYFLHTLLLGYRTVEGVDRETFKKTCVPWPQKNRLIGNMHMYLCYTGPLIG